jgi:hypothetical protein
MGESSRYVWLVVGSDGVLGEERSAWLVAAYHEEEQARLHADMADALVPQPDGRGELWDPAHAEACKRAQALLRRTLDPEARVNYTTAYDVQRTPLVRHVDEFKELHLGG